MIEVTPLMVEVSFSNGRTKVGGRVIRKSSGEDVTYREPTATGLLVYGDLTNVKEYPSTHARDKALLVALGVDGDVPLSQALVNAGLGRGPANDNHKPAALAA